MLQEVFLFKYVLAMYSSVSEWLWRKTINRHGDQKWKGMTMKDIQLDAERMSLMSTSCSTAALCLLGQSEGTDVIVAFCTCS